MRREIAVELIALFPVISFSVWFLKKIKIKKFKKKKPLKSDTSVCFQITNVPQPDFGQEKKND